MMPKEFVKQRLWCAEKLCLRPNGVSRNLQDLVFGAMNSFGQSGWGLTADEFLKSARAMADLALSPSAAWQVCHRVNARFVAQTWSGSSTLSISGLWSLNLSLADIARETGLTLKLPAQAVSR